MKTGMATKTKVVKATVKATLASLLQNAGTIPQSIMEIPLQCGFDITGPQYWTYRGADGNPETEFELEIAVPVSGNGSVPDGFIVGDTDEFPCVVHTHQGAWSEFTQVYENLIPQIVNSGKVLNGMCREVYLQCDMEDPKNCITELQIGIQ